MLERKASNSGQRKVWGALVLGIVIGGIAGYAFGQSIVPWISGLARITIPSSEQPVTITAPESVPTTVPTEEVSGEEASPEAAITYPDDGATVEIREMVRGTSQNIPERQVIWIVVYSQVAGRYYPQNYPADVQANGDWSSLAFIGIKEDSGKKFKFDIIAVLADEKAQDTFNDYLIQAKDKEKWEGLERLPEGALIYDRITVTRK